MTRPTEPLRAEHAGFLPHIDGLRTLALTFPDLALDDRRTTLADAVSFLRGTLIPHARLEEAVIYPAWADLVGYPDAAITMVHDHRAIVGRIERLEEVDPADTGLVQELLFGLYALISVHFAAEEELQLSAFDADPTAAAALFDALRAHHAH